MEQGKFQRIGDYVTDGEYTFRVDEFEQVNDIHFVLTGGPVTEVCLNKSDGKYRMKIPGSRAEEIKAAMIGSPRQ